MYLRLSLLLTLVCLLCAPPAHAQDGGGEPVVSPYAGYALGELLGPLTEDRLFADSVVGLQVVRVSTGEEVFAYKADDAITPASVTKVLTAAVALRRLGPAWRFETALMADGEVSPEGVLEGDLYIRGGGDPTLVVEKLWKMIHDLKVSGIVEIDGDVVFDDSFFVDDPLIPGWDKKVDIANGPAYYAPLGALSVNYNSATIVVAPGPEAGQPARVELETPAGSSIVLESELMTVSKSSRGSLEIEREVDDRTGSVTFRLAGRVPLGTETRRHYRAVGHPRTHFIGVFAELFVEEGISYSGKMRIGETPDSAQVAVSLLSPPLSEVLNHTLKYSSNFMAEQVLRAVGGEVVGAPGSTEKGLAVLGEYLTSLGIPADSYALLNGSGLSRSTRLAPSLVNAVLLDMARDPALAPEFLSALSVGGVDGTLRRRFAEDGEVGLVRGKTGSLNGVYCVAAVVQAANGERYAFTFLVNDIGRTSPARDLQDRVGEALLGIGRVPDADGT